MYERHRPVLRRQAGRLLYGSGHDSDDVLQDVFLRVHTALRGGVVPLEPRAWLLRLVHNACVDELRRARTRPVGDVELDGMPALAEQLPDELAHRAEARALLGDIHRLPERQRHVLVMSAIEGLSHEEVAGRLDTTVETTRSLLARARENLRRTAAARETACQFVCDALDEAASAGVRASEIARRHLWTCSDCRAYQRDLRASPSRLRRLAGWSPWGIVAQLLGGGGGAAVQKVAVGACCAIVGVSGAVAVPEIAVHSRHAPELATVVPPDPEANERAARRERSARERPVSPAPAAPTTTVVAHVATPAPKRVATKKVKRTKPRTPPTAARYTRLSRTEQRRLSLAMRSFYASNPTAEERKEMASLLRDFQRSSGAQRNTALLRIGARAFGKNLSGPAPTRPARPAPPKGIATPAPTPEKRAPEPTPTPTPHAPAPTPAVATPTPPPAEPTPTPPPAEPTPTATPDVVPTATP